MSSVLTRGLHNAIRFRALAAPQLLRHSVMAATTAAAAAPSGALTSHAGHFKLERGFALGMLPLFPAAYFIHGPVMDYALTVALTLHIHWGLMAVAHDYARPIVVGETMAAVLPKTVYLLTVLLFAGLLHFNYNDVGLTRAFELVFSL